MCSLGVEEVEEENMSHNNDRDDIYWLEPTQISCLSTQITLIHTPKTKTHTPKQIHNALTSGVELHKLRILEGNACSEGHGISITGAGVCTGAGEVSTTVAAGGQHSVVGSVYM